MQVLNVAMGGTLIQDIPSQVTGALEHSVPRAALRIAHEVWVAKGSQLSTLLADHMEDGETCHVNSRHHQSVKDAAKGFDVTATSPDGVDRGDGESRTRRSASPCNGIRRISGGPANSASCSKASCRPLTGESDNRLDVRGVRKQIERAR